MKALHRFLDLEDLDDQAIAELLAVAKEVQARPISDALKGRVLGLIFMNPSLRTLASFQAGMSQLGGSSFVITPGASTWALEMRDGAVMDGSAPEHVREAIPVLASYCDAIGVRAFSEGQDLERELAEPVITPIAKVCPKPLINLESAINHPCQALADWKTLDDLKVPRQGGKFVLSWANHPKALPMAVPAAAVTMAARRGMEVVVLRPDGYALPEPIMSAARQAASFSGGSVRESVDRGEALQNAHVLYAKSWGSPLDYGRPADEARRRAPLKDWCVTEDWFAPARKEAIFLHCLPVRRNVVVADHVLDGPRSRVLVQAENRLHVQKAVLLASIGAAR